MHYAEGKHIAYQPRLCDCCGGDDLEELWVYTKTVSTVRGPYIWQVRNVICKQCGFVFVSPAPQESSLEEYYTATFADLEGQRLDYSIPKRITLIEKYLRDKKDVSYVEIGGSTNSDAFTKALPRNIVRIKQIEINAKSRRDADKLDPSQKSDIIVGYFVLEHVPKPKDFLGLCAQTLKEGGILIIEVPNLDIYATDPSGLLLWEHTNHFSPRSLARLAASQGFQLMEISHENCSRSFGFAAVFIKNSALGIPVEASDYQSAKECMLAGIARLEAYPRKLKAVWDKINEVSIGGGRVLSSGLLMRYAAAFLQSMRDVPCQ